MKLGYVCQFGHLIVGMKPDHLQGQMIDKIFCPYCQKEERHVVATKYEDSAMQEQVPAVFEFFKPSLIVDLDPNDKELLDRGYLLIRLYEDSILKKELEASKSITKLAQFLIQYLEPHERLPDIVDTAIRELNTHFSQKTVVKRMKTERRLN